MNMRRIGLSASYMALAVVGLFSGGCGSGGGESSSQPNADVLSRLSPYVSIATTTSEGTTVLFDGASASSRDGDSSVSVTATVTVNASSSAYSVASSSSSSTTSSTTVMHNGMTVVSVSARSQIGAYSPGTDINSDDAGTVNAAMQPTAIGISAGFDGARAQRDGLTLEEVRLGQSYVGAIPALVAADKREETRGFAIDLILPGYTDFVTRYESVLKAIADKQDNPGHSSTLFDNPNPYTPGYVHVHNGESFDSKWQAQRAMWDRGFHLVKPYASGGGNRELVNFQRDAEWHPDRGRPMDLLSNVTPESGTYRDEVVLADPAKFGYPDKRWRFYIQYHEPNPELLAVKRYPVWWWGIYVYWYHNNF
jgi:hypothetical protein